MINLFPPTKQKSVVREYRLRVVVVALSSLLLVLLGSATLLAPSYFVSVSKLESARVEEAVYSRSDASKEQAVFEEIVQKTNEKLTLLKKTEHSSSVRSLFTLVLNERPFGVKIEGIFYEKDSAEERLVVRGEASSRDTLIAFRDALAGHDEFSEANLPISNLVSDREIPYSIRLTVRGDANVETEIES